MTTTLISLLTFLLGLLLGNWLAIGRDKRKEFNEAAAPVLGWLLKAKESPSPYSSWPSSQEIDRFIHYLRPGQRSKFLSRLATYKTLHETMQVQDELGSVSYRDVQAIRNELSQLFKFTRPR